MAFGLVVIWFLTAVSRHYPSEQIHELNCFLLRLYFCSAVVNCGNVSNCEDWTKIKATRKRKTVAWVWILLKRVDLGTIPKDKREPSVEGKLRSHNYHLWQWFSTKHVRQGVLEDQGWEPLMYGMFCVLFHTRYLSQDLDRPCFLSTAGFMLFTIWCVFQVALLGCPVWFSQLWHFNVVHWEVFNILILNELIWKTIQISGIPFSTMPSLYFAKGHCQLFIQEALFLAFGVKRNLMLFHSKQ